ncbi:MAG: hypothetical protein IJV41_07970 [Oscillospiraceae bacterium]|nr:hypothetical protein [Oscillospiraceae bacterium]
MKTTNKMLWLLMALGMLLSLCACGNVTSGENAEIIVIGEPQVSTETEPGYVTTELPMPEDYRDFSGLQSVGDSLYLHAETADGNFAVLRYDTLTQEWKSWAVNTGEAKYPQIEAFSVADGAVWLRLMEGYSDSEMVNRDFARKLHYYLIVLDTQTGEQLCTRIDFWRNGNNSDPYLTGLVALDKERAILNDDETVRLISRDAQVLEKLNLPLIGFTECVWIGDTPYLSTNDGYCPFDPDTLQCGKPLEGILWEPVYSSQRGRILVTKERVLQEYDPHTGSMSPVFNWMDIALNYASLQGYSAFYGLENSNGDLFYLANNKLTKVSPGMVPVKKTLTLGCFADATAQGYEYSDTDYTCPERLLDAIMRFNQTDPEYRIVLKPMIWYDEAERNKLMIRLATESGIDVLDTSLLPPGAVDRQLLVDLLPYIDADPNISREDFIPSLFAALTERGGLYEYADRFTMLTMLGAEHLGISREEWTTDRALEVLSREDSSPYFTQDKMILLFSWAATAEFMDRASGTCSFDSPAFIGWLELMKRIPVIPPDGAFFNSPGCDWLISYDYASKAGYGPRKTFQDEAAVLGFPGTAGTGAYFMKLLPADGMGHTGQLKLDDGFLWTIGCNTSLGVMASSKSKDGAWRFVKTFMQGETEPYLTDGIPVLRASFEKAVENSMQRQQSNVNDYESFNEKDAAVMRELVYGTDRMVIRDDAVMDALKTEITAFLGGKERAEEAARLIQSKMSLYMSEHYG